MRRVFLAGLALLVALGLGLSPFHHHAKDQDCSICKLLGPSTAAGQIVTAVAGQTLRAHAIPAARSHVPLPVKFSTSPLRAPPSA